jgi:hypothetical protein
MSHFIEKCSLCNVVISQCRCMTCDKETRWSTCTKCGGIPRQEPIFPYCPVSKDQYIVEALGKCWHENKIAPYSGGTMRLVCSKCGSIDYNPDYAANPLLVLKEMKYRCNFQDFLDYLRFNDRLGVIPVDYLFDTTGQLRDKAIEFLRDRN